MNYKQYDIENGGIYWEITCYSHSDDYTVKLEFSEYGEPDLNKLAEIAKKAGYTAFEVRKITTDIIRYEIESDNNDDK